MKEQKSYLGSLLATCDFLFRRSTGDCHLPDEATYTDIVPISTKFGVNITQLDFHLS